MMYEDVIVGQYVVSGPEMGTEMAGQVVEIGGGVVSVRWDDGHEGHLDAGGLVLDTRYAQPEASA